MGPREILWRINLERIKFAERVAYQLGLYAWGPNKWQRRLCRHVEPPPAPPTLAVWWLRHVRSRYEPAFLLDCESLAESTELYGRIFPDRLESAVQDAERVCRGEFSFLGIEFQADPAIDWQRDPVTGRNWPALFYADVRIPFCDGTGSRGVAGDAKHVWELNRHEFLIDCAKAYCLTQESRFARRVFHIIMDWINANPYLQGVNWASPLEVALRSMSWLWAYQFCRSWDELSADDHLDLIKAFYRHGTYLYRHLEVYSSPNNHLVGEATALYLLGSFFPEFDESAAWRDRAWSILILQPSRQFYEDGGSTEQATSYHHYCLGFLVLAVLTRMRQELPVPPAMLKQLEAAFSFSMWMTTPNGTVPCIGDTDDARSIRFGKILLWDFRNFLSIGAAMFQRGDMKAVAESFSEDALWLLGAQGLRTFRALPNKVPSETSRVFSASGYAIMRSDWETTGHHTCIDCGSIGFDLRGDDIPIFTHGHADMLSLTISTFGKPLLVDAGFYTYNGPPDWHRYTRDIQGHNTIRVDGQSQAKFHRKNAWACVSQQGPILHKPDKSFEVCEGCHSGFVGVKDCTRHRRTVVWDRKSCWLIRDRLEGSGTHFVEAFFHFAPGSLKILPDESGVSIATAGDVYAVLRVADANSLQVDARCGEAEPDGGWIATCYGCKQPAPVVRFHGEVRFPHTMTFLLTSSLEESASPAIEQFTVLNESGEERNDAVGTRVLSHKGEELLELCCRTQANLSITEMSVTSMPPRSQSNERSAALLPT